MCCNLFIAELKKHRTYIPVKWSSAIYLLIVFLIYYFRFVFRFDLKANFAYNYLSIDDSLVYYIRRLAKITSFSIVTFLGIVSIINSNIEQKARSWQQLENLPKSILNILLAKNLSILVLASVFISIHLFVYRILYNLTPHLLKEAQIDYYHTPSFFDPNLSIALLSLICVFVFLYFVQCLFYLVQNIYLQILLLFVSFFKFLPGGVAYHSIVALLSNQPIQEHDLIYFSMAILCNALLIVLIRNRPVSK